MVQGNAMPQASTSEMLSALSSFGSKLSSETASQLSALSEGQQSTDTNATTTDSSENTGDPVIPSGIPAISNEPATTPVDNTGGTGTTSNTEPVSDDPKGPTMAEEFEIESPLFGGKKKITPPNEEVNSPEKATFDSLDSLSSFLKEKHGLNDVSELVAKVDEWKQKEVEYSGLSEKISNAESIFSNMHPDLYKAVVLDAKGEDFRSVLSSSIDYSKNEKDYTDKDLVNAFYPGKITDEEWEEYSSEDGDPTVKKLVSTIIDNSIDAFKSKKSQVEDMSREEIRKAQERQTLFESSIKKSEQSLLQKFSDIDNSYIEKLNKSFKENGIYSVFYNNDGSLRDDAHLRLAMAMDGEGIVDQYKKILENKIVTKTNQEILTRTADVPSGSRGSNSDKSTEIRPEVQAQIDSLRGFKGAKKY